MKKYKQFIKEDFDYQNNKFKFLDRIKYKFNNLRGFYLGVAHHRGGGDAIVKWDDDEDIYVVLSKNILLDDPDEDSEESNMEEWVEENYTYGRRKHKHPLILEIKLDLQNMYKSVDIMDRLNITVDMGYDQYPLGVLGIDIENVPESWVMEFCDDCVDLSKSEKYKNKLRYIPEESENGILSFEILDEPEEDNMEEWVEENLVHKKYKKGTKVLYKGHRSKFDNDNMAGEVGVIKKVLPFDGDDSTWPDYYLELLKYPPSVKTPKNWRFNIGNEFMVSEDDIEPYQEFEEQNYEEWLEESVEEDIEKEKYIDLILDYFKRANVKSEYKFNEINNYMKSKLQDADIVSLYIASRFCMENADPEELKKIEDIMNNYRDIKSNVIDLFEELSRGVSKVIRELPEEQNYEEWLEESRDSTLNPQKMLCFDEDAGENKMYFYRVGDDLILRNRYEGTFGSALSCGKKYKILAFLDYDSDPDRKLVQIRNNSGSLDRYDHRFFYPPIKEEQIENSNYEEWVEEKTITKFENF